MTIIIPEWVMILLTIWLVFAIIDRIVAIILLVLSWFVAKETERTIFGTRKYDKI